MAVAGRGEITYYMEIDLPDLTPLENAKRTTESVNEEVKAFRANMTIVTAGIRGVNAARLAIEQTERAIAKLDPRAAMYAFLNMVQVIRNLTSFLMLLSKVTWAQNAAQAALATLTGQWWLIPLALAAAGAMLAFGSRSMQWGGEVEEAGWYYLHRKEIVIPTGQTINKYSTINYPAQIVNRVSNVSYPTTINKPTTINYPTTINRYGSTINYAAPIVNRYGPFILNVSERPLDPEEFFRQWSWEVASRLRGS